MRGLIVVLLVSLTCLAQADERALRSARKEKIAGIALSFIGLAISVTGGIFAIVNRGFDRDTPEQRLRFGLSVGLAAAAAPIVTAGVTLWAHGAVRERRAKARVAIALDGLQGTF